MHRVTPRVFLIGETRILDDGLSAYLDHVGTKWVPFKSTAPGPAPTHPEQMIEVMGRLCYRAWEPGLNPNVTKIREGNDVYIANLVKSKHGSVLEHSVTNWIIADCSRVFTHELVRHRAGTAFSQESLRYVRLTDLGLWLPPEIEADRHLVKMFERTFEDLEELQKQLSTYLGLDSEKSFETKKKFTSAMRRAAPIGLATTIGFSANFRALRHIGEMRTSGGAEAEIRLILDQIMTISKARWPNVFADFERTENGWVTLNSKV
jgi:thymidylate synthase (FAD)